MAHLARASRDIGTAIRNTRRQRKLTQARLSQLSGVWQDTISKVERGVGDPKLETIFALLAALDLELTVADRSKGTTESLEDVF